MLRAAVMSKTTLQAYIDGDNSADVVFAAIQRLDVKPSYTPGSDPVHPLFKLADKVQGLLAAESESADAWLAPLEALYDKADVADREAFQEKYAKSFDMILAYKVAKRVEDSPTSIRGKSPSVSTLSNASWFPSWVGSSSGSRSKTPPDEKMPLLPKSAGPAGAVVRASTIPASYGAHPHIGAEY